MKNVKKVVLYAVIVIAVIGCAIAIKNKLTISAKSKPAQAAVSKTSVEVQTAQTTKKTSGDIYKATLEAYQQGIISSKTSAKVVSVSFENGQYVNAGDTLVTLDDQDIRNNIKTAQAQLQTYESQLNSTQVALEKLKVNLDDAQRNYDRQKTLFEGQAISQTDFEAAEKTLKSAKADYDSGNASIQTAQSNIETEKVTISNLQDTLSNTIIKAPISGIISNKNLNIGQMASSGASLATVNDISSVYATIQVPQEKISIVKTGQAATLTVDGSDQNYNGIVQYIDGAADTTSRVFNVKVKIDNSDKSLLPGIYGKVTLISDQNAEVLTVPVNALVGNEGNYSVFINDNGKAKKTKVTIGETSDNNVEVTSGVKSGDQIICTNTSTLQDGDEINVVAKQNDSGQNATDKKDNSSEDTASK
ncbi:MULTISPECIES: efflux RND transporter periplasmic adaptor subunit [unclassified Clostridium]|uniref:efflux RND transporter periplasmic adaptor subunit n=1 Tax=unclassified Clostridium TaxID=2614128 RepID=UPI000297E8AC|nr:MULTISPECIES: efflux RND transporter periplasmic adaptor subunit [unclassified Clostridium]EKQ53615.1 MAG: RND family efflux transporter, MFP subunit [Clostridium sp. Maddingley MBC34-26]